LTSKFFFCLLLSGGRKEERRGVGPRRKRRKAKKRKKKRGSGFLGTTVSHILSILTARLTNRRKSLGGRGIKKEKKRGKEPLEGRSQSLQLHLRSMAYRPSVGYLWAEGKNVLG